MRHSNKERDNVAESRPGSNTDTVQRHEQQCCWNGATYRKSKCYYSFAAAVGPL